MNFFTKMMKTEQDLVEYEKKEKALIDAQLILFRKEKELGILDEVIRESASVLQKTIDNAKELGDSECDFHAALSEKEVKLASLDAEIKGRELALSAIKDIKQAEIEMLKDSHKAAIADKDKFIELLTTQVEVLTAKLTEIKIDSVQLTANLKTDKE